MAVVKESCPAITVKAVGHPSNLHDAYHVRDVQRARQVNCRVSMTQIILQMFNVLNIVCWTHLRVSTVTCYSHTPSFDFDTCDRTVDLVKILTGQLYLCPSTHSVKLFVMSNRNGGLRALEWEHLRCLRRAVLCLEVLSKRRSSTSRMVQVMVDVAIPS